MWIVDTIDGNGFIYHVSASLGLFHSGITGSVDQRGLVLLCSINFVWLQDWLGEEMTRVAVSASIETQLFSALFYISGAQIFWN